MANYLASIFGTEQDKVRDYPITIYSFQLTDMTPGELLLLLQNRRVQTRRSLLTKACQTLLQPDDSSPEPVSEPGI